MRGVHGGVGTIYLDLQLTWPGIGTILPQPTLPPIFQKSLYFKAARNSVSLYTYLMSVLRKRTKLAPSTINFLAK